MCIRDSFRTSAQYLSTSITSVNEDVAATRTTYLLTVTLLENGTQNVHTLFGTPDSPMTIPPAFQTDNAVAGADIGGVSPDLLESTPESQFDSWLSVGLTAGNNGEISSSGIDFSGWGPNDGLVVVNGEVSWVDPLAGPTGAEIVVGQLTVPTGSDFTATVNLLSLIHI